MKVKKGLRSYLKYSFNRLLKISLSLRCRAPESWRSLHSDTDHNDLTAFSSSHAWWSDDSGISLLYVCSFHLELVAHYTLNNMVCTVPYPHIWLWCSCNSPFLHHKVALSLQSMLLLLPLSAESWCPDVSWRATLVDIALSQIQLEQQQNMFGHT